MATIMSLDDNAAELQVKLAKDLKSLRLSRSLTLKTLEQMTGVKYVTIKKFEATGQLSLTSLLKIAEGLGILHRFTDLLVTPDEPLTVDELQRKISKTKPRQRGSK